MKYFFSLAIVLVGSVAAAADAPDYAKDVLPIFNKYCNGCHNPDDREGKLDLTTFEATIKGGAKGTSITPGNADQSRLIRLITGEGKPQMPPEDSDAPSADEVAVLKAWINSGAKGPSGHAPDPADTQTPVINPTVKVAAAINAMAVSPDGNIIALAKFGKVELVKAQDGKFIRELTGHRGRVNAVAFSRDGSLLVAGAGEPALIGEARLWRVEDGKLLQTYRGHKDCVYAVAISPDGKLVATGSYDQSIRLWSPDQAEAVKSLNSHNGAVFALEFRADGQVLASASDDRTVKLWNPATGERLDTLSQSTKELYTLAFSPDGKRLAAAGVDNRIRVWGISESAKEGSNPLVFSQFAHEAAVLRIAYSPDGSTLVSTAEDKLVKVWNASNMTIRTTLPAQAEWVSGVAALAETQEVLVSRLDGQLERFRVADAATDTILNVTPLDEVPPAIDYGPQPKIEQLTKVAEKEPNDSPAEATTLSAPGVATGRIALEGDRLRDADLYRFTAKAGEQWIVETNAARSGSALDSKIEVLHGDGRPVQRMLLRAVRDSEIEFRGINSDARGARLKYWEELLLRQYVYMSGEVVKQFQQRRGPDADAQFYPEGGSRITYFDTTARTHALAEPCYVVVPYSIGTRLPNNGLPVFTLHFENDDDAQRKLGKDSKLTFTAPADGEYLVRVTDVRGFAGGNFMYSLVVRRPQPGFNIRFAGENPTVGRGSGKVFTVKADRIDNFNGPITVELSDVPPGFSVTTPIVIEDGHYEAQGVLFALPQAPQPPSAPTIKARALADVAGKMVVKETSALGAIKLADTPKVQVSISPVEGRINFPPQEALAERKFEVLTPADAKSASGATLTRLDDHSLRAGDTNPDSDTYVVSMPVGQRTIRAIRLDVVGDDTFPSKSPGRAPNNGNFVLSEFSVAVASAKDPGNPAQVELKSATVDYAQPGWAGEGLIDGNPKTGWAIAEPGPNNTFPVKRRGDDPSHYAIFELAAPLEVNDGSTLVVTLAQTSDVKQHNVGRFKLSVTSDEFVTPVLDFPEVPEVAIVPGHETQVRLKVRRNGFKGRIPIEVENLPHGVIVNDIGLSGVLINPQEEERVVFLHCEPWVAPQDRLCTAVAKVEGDQASPPLRIRVKSPAR